MNLLLLEPEELGGEGVTQGRVRLSDRRAEHLRRILRVEVGRELRCGVLGGGTGSARVSQIEPMEIEVEVEITEPPPPEPWLDLVVALPRPQVLHRVLQFSASMGVGRLDFVKSWRVEKSFFSSPSLRRDTVRRHLLLGAEQGLFPRLPEVTFHQTFLSYIALADTEQDPPCRLLAHPDAERTVDARLGPGMASRVRLAIGPEGGWIDREVKTFETIGFESVSLGPWMLRVEAALVAGAAQIEMLRRIPWGTSELVM